jgi:hypothetical protein
VSQFGDERLPLRFWDKCAVDANGCWQWSGAKNKGYGRFSANGTNEAHRAAYLSIVGPIQPGLVLDHLCRVPACVNPDHLEPVTDRVNVLRGIGPSARRAVATQCENGHAFNAENTIPKKNGAHRQCRECHRLEASRRYRLLVEAGICAMAKTHGPATRGVYCADCAVKLKERDAARRKVAKAVGL